MMPVRRRAAYFRLTIQRPWLCAWLVMSFAFAAPPALAQSNNETGLIGASNERHAWLLADSAESPGHFVLMHHPPSPDGDHASALFTLTERPVAMAAWDDRVWLIDQEDSSMRRRVLTTRVTRNPTTGLFVADPPGRMELAPPLEGSGVLAGAVGSDRGLIVLLAPPQFAEVEIVRTPPVPQNQVQVLRTPRLLRLEGLKWVELDLPDIVRVTHASHLSGGGSPGGGLVIITPAEHDAERTEVFTQSGDEWKHSIIDLNLRDVLGMTRVGTHSLLVRETAGPAGISPRLDLSYLRPDGLSSIHQLDRPQRPFAVLGLAEGVRIFTQTAPARLTVQRLGPLGGALSEPIELTAPSGSRYLWYGTLLFALAVGAVFFVLISRPTEQAVSLPEDVVVMGAFSRLVAVLIDLVPAAGLALLITGAPLDHLINLPITTIQPADALTYVLAVLLTVAHGTVGELIWGTTLGKWLMGGRMIAADGSRARAGQTLARNGVKLLILLMPPLAVIMILNRNVQGLNDLIARTVVVRQKPPEPEESE